MVKSPGMTYFADDLPVEGASAGDINLPHFGAFFEKQYGESLDQAGGEAGIPLVQLLGNLGLARKT
jgi:hypothetical protein